MQKYANHVWSCGQHITNFSSKAWLIDWGKSFIFRIATAYQGFLSTYKKATNKVMPVRLWPPLNAFHCNSQPSSFCWQEWGNAHGFNSLCQEKTWAMLTRFYKGEMSLWVASLLTLGLSWGHPEKSTKSFTEQRITRIFQDQSYHKYLWQLNILLFNELWSWMNEWSFQWSFTFSCISGVGYFIPK